MKKWRRLATCRKTAPAVFKQNEVIEMQNHHIMALALALRNVQAGRRVKVPAMTGSQLHLLMMWLQALRG
ncbi:hypothetical protein ASU91_10215 [Enterobacter hormaechei subsp. steigerwaltii]|nr:hypothetical protein FZH99_17530 [Cronobacter sakazakii]KJL76322.1 hypothetical protein SS35_09120 [Enterobacter hormaechei subsp. steigerwaltii]MBK2956151.1 hypothetical protein [Enterobacter hormaechei]KAB0960715.1 hypothetical protein FZI52_15820 [Cronobacter sakazakii]KAB0998048.1 hypothetical protein FZI32_04765 [Cronobacter sakazakii]